MLEIIEMSDQEMKSLLTNVGYGHLGCARDSTPYVIPLHYVYLEPHIYVYTTAGKKTEFISANHQVCLQVEDVRNASEWRSVIVTGYADEITEPAEKQQALGFIRLENPDLKPALARTWLGALTRSQNEIIYRIRVHHMTGRRTL